MAKFPTYSSGNNWLPNIGSLNFSGVSKKQSNRNQSNIGSSVAFGLGQVLSSFGERAPALATLGRLASLIGGLL